MLTNDFLKIMGNIVQSITIDTLKTSLYRSPEQRISSDIPTTCSGCKKNVRYVTDSTHFWLSEHLWKHCVSLESPEQQSKAYLLN